MLRDTINITKYTVVFFFLCANIFLTRTSSISGGIDDECRKSNLREIYIHPQYYDDVIICTEGEISLAYFKAGIYALVPYGASRDGKMETAMQIIVPDPLKRRFYKMNLQDGSRVMVSGIVTYDKECWENSKRPSDLVCVPPKPLTITLRGIKFTRR